MSANGFRRPRVSEPSLAAEPAFSESSACIPHEAWLEVLRRKEIAENLRAAHGKANGDVRAFVRYGVAMLLTVSGALVAMVWLLTFDV